MPVGDEDGSRQAKRPGFAGWGAIFCALLAVGIGATLLIEGYDSRTEGATTVYQAGDAVRWLWAAAFGFGTLTFVAMAFRRHWRVEALCGLGILLFLGLLVLPSRLSEELVISDRSVTERSSNPIGGRNREMVFANVARIVPWGERKERIGGRVPRTVIHSYWYLHRHNGRVDPFELSPIWKAASDAILDAAYERGVAIHRGFGRRADDILEVALLDEAYRLNDKADGPRLSAFVLGGHLWQARNSQGKTFHDHLTSGGTAPGTWTRVIPTKPTPLVARLLLDEDGAFEFQVTAEDLDRTVTGTWRRTAAGIALEARNQLLEVVLAGD